MTGPPPLLGTHDDALAAADAVAAALVPGVVARDRAGRVPWDALAVVDGSGLLGVTVGDADGGPGLGARTLAEVVRRIAAVDPAVAQVPQGHFLFVDVLTVAGAPAARGRLLGAALRGERLGNALAERGGQHAQDLRTRLSRAPDDTLRLQGRKYYCTGAISSRWIAVSALDDAERLVAVVVPRDAPGVTADDDWDVVGQRATVSGTTSFDDVRVDPEHVVDYGALFQAPQLLGARAQLVHAAIQTGIAGGALRDARAFLRERARPSSETVRAGYHSPVEDPATLGRYGRASVRVRAAEALLREAAETLDELGRVPADRDAATRGSLAVAAAKALATEAAADVAGELFVLCGTSATDARHDLDRHWRNARTHGVHDPVDWKYHHIAAHELGGVHPPNHGQL